MHRGQLDLRESSYPRDLPVMGRIFRLDQTPLQYSPLFQEKPTTTFSAEVRHLGSGEIEPKSKEGQT